MSWYGSRRHSRSNRHEPRPAARSFLYSWANAGISSRTGTGESGGTTGCPLRRLWFELVLLRLVNDDMSRASIRRSASPKVISPKNTPRRTVSGFRAPTRGRSRRSC